MAGSNNKKIMIVVTVFLLVVAVGLSLLLILDETQAEDELAPPAEYETISPEEMNAQPSMPQFDYSAPADSKYLWQYGSQKISGSRPIEIETEAPETSGTVPSEETQYEPETYFEVITNWLGEAVTDESGNEVTEIRTKPHTVIYTEYVTDENGEAVTDENGNAVTELFSEEVTTAPPPVYVTGEDGEPITDENGEMVLESTEEATEERTHASVGNRPEGSSQWAQAMTDGERYTTVKVYLDGEYDVDRSSVMTVTLREKSGLINIPDTLTYNLYKGTCSLSPTKKQDGMAFVTKSAGQTIVTLIIPEEARPNVADTTALSAKSTISTFKDSNGVDIDEFSVSVNLS